MTVRLKGNKVRLPEQAQIFHHLQRSLHCMRYRASLPRG